MLNKYRLELHWDSVKYKDDVAVLSGAYFCGPVLKNAAKIQSNDQLILDMTSQHMIFIPDYYQAYLRWKDVEYKEDKVYLKGATIQGRYVNSIETLSDTDWILIDCQNHEEQLHPFHLVYFAEVRRKEGMDKYGG